MLNNNKNECAAAVFIKWCIIFQSKFHTLSRTNSAMASKKPFYRVWVSTFYQYELQSIFTCIQVSLCVPFSKSLQTLTPLV